MTGPEQFIAVDLGASSGRVVLGRLDDARLRMREVHRFATAGAADTGNPTWDVEAIEREIRAGIKQARKSAGGKTRGIGIDSWGVDYVLVSEEGKPVRPPCHYRHPRTAGVMDRVCGELGRAAIFDRTGVQFMPINTLYQLRSEAAADLERAATFLMIADWFAHRLGGLPLQEVTLASTTQMLDPRTRTWARDLVEDARLPTRLLPELVEAGTTLGDFDGLPIIATAAHDTAAAVAGCPGSGDDWAFLSSGTWSLLGVELPQPLVSDEALDANLSNELGIRGTTRLLKNICGLWPLQECRREWADRGADHSWDELRTLAENAQPLATIIDPDDARFLAPASMSDAIGEYCRDTGQPAPADVGATVRCVLESLALKCRCVVELLERVTGRAIRTIHMVGGGVQNALLCRFTADATGRRVVAGPVEATAVGNIMTQAMGAGLVVSMSDAREIIARSFDLVTCEPQPSAAWEDAYARLKQLLQYK